MSCGHPAENVFKKGFKTLYKGRMEQKVWKTTLQTPRSEKEENKKTSAASKEVHDGVDIHTHRAPYIREVRYSWKSVDNGETTLQWGRLEDEVAERSCC